MLRLHDPRRDFLQARLIVIQSPNPDGGCSSHCSGPKAERVVPVGDRLNTSPPYYVPGSVCRQPAGNECQIACDGNLQPQIC